MKKSYAALFLAAAVMLQPVTSYAAPSPSTRPSATQADNRDRNISKDYKRTDFKSASGGGTPGVSVVPDTGGTAGQAVSVDLIFGAGTDQSVLGLSADVVDKINTINNGVEPLYRTLGTPDLVGYSPLTPVSTVAAKEGAAVDPQSKKVSLTVYVPNLIEGLNEVQILYFNRATGKWERIAPASIDFAAKRVSLSVDDGTPFTVIYKSKQ